MTSTTLALRHSSNSNDVPIQHRIPQVESESDEEVEAWAMGHQRHEMYPRGFNRFHHNEFPYYKIKIYIPCFDGHLHIEDFLDWI
ncbi:hypothetical protein Scep_020298 [Stephania cephalantha]|uniref:Uncharacterized protein n=1 Tax=Stephania cephalantha TaxID=152367 RepID=A0AAP0NNV4_9MAGN